MEGIPCTAMRTVPAEAAFRQVSDADHHTLAECRDSSLFFKSVDLWTAALKLVLFCSRNSFAVLKALKNKGVPAKDSGETGPTVINE